MSVFRIKTQPPKKITRNQIKDINRTKYAQEISSKIKDVNVIAIRSAELTRTECLQCGKNSTQKRIRRKGGGKDSGESNPPQSQ